MTTTTTTTTAAPQVLKFERGELPPNAVEDVMAMIEMYPQLQGREDEIFNASPPAEGIKINYTFFV